MIRMLAPWALAGAALLAGPLLVHMLLRRHARRVSFPATHFLLATPAAAVRFRRPSDIGLMFLRLAIVAAAVVAVAQPIVVTPLRVAQWDARTVRAVIVDTGRSMPSADDAMRFAGEEMRAFHSQRFASSDLREALERAAAWFADTPPGRREVVIISDFQRGAVAAEDFQALPAGVGVRPIRVGNQPAVRDVTLPIVAGFRGGAWRPSLRVEPGGTGVTWTRAGDAPNIAWLTTAQAVAETEAARRAVRAAVSFGVASGDDTRQVRVRFAGAPPKSANLSPLKTRWMVDAALALRRSALLGETNATVMSGEQDGRLVVETTAAAASAAAPAVVRAVMLAVRPGSIADREAEVVTVPDAEVALWRREPAPIDPVSGRLAAVSDSDARWLWLLALVLLGVETWARRPGGRATGQEARDAA